jgi:hypothetical protein
MGCRHGLQQGKGEGAAEGRQDDEPGGNQQAAVGEKAAQGLLFLGRMPQAPAAQAARAHATSLPSRSCVTT